jgi:8-oxo-dGTP pyrophosphatase MutT (NUDIX family)
MTERHEMQKNGKRWVALFIPYRIENGVVLIYLQKRSMDMERIPGYWGYFGGGLEQEETPEQAMLRETKEELNYVPKDYFQVFHGITELDYKEVFCEKVDKDFELQITVLEGDYGQWFSIEEALRLEKFIERDKRVLPKVESIILTK